MNRLQALKEEDDRWPDFQAEIIFEGIPRTPLMAKTDADGRFFIKVPRKGRYAFAAKASRQVSGKDETYFWLFWFRANSDGSKVFLSNDNLVGSFNPDSIVPVRDNMWSISGDNMKE